MATKSDSEVTKLASEVDGLSVADEFEANITICSWNINGTAKPVDRENVTMETFKYQFTNKSEGPTSLGQADIICVQEMTVKPDGRKAKKYLPYIDNYTAVYNDEPSGSLYNANFFKKEKLKEGDSTHINQAFKLMEIKKYIYDEIERGGDVKKTKAEQGKLETWDERKKKGKKRARRAWR